jgi:pyridoxamine 5'-phosphate oxidase
MVLLKGADERGFVFYTNYESRKGRELAENGHAALLFYWDPLGRQVRIEGTVERIAREDSAAYFRTRPRGSMLSAWVSPQSEPLAGRDELEEALGRAADRFEGAEVPLPPHWGGYRLVPSGYEFWQHREDRLHDRIRYEPVVDAGWRRVRLAP